MTGRASPRTHLDRAAVTRSSEGTGDSSCPVVPASQEFSGQTLCWEGPRLRAHLLKLANGRRAAGRVLAHAHGSVVLIQLAHLAVFAVMVLAGVW